MASRNRSIWLMTVFLITSMSVVVSERPRPDLVFCNDFKVAGRYNFRNQSCYYVGNRLGDNDRLNKTIPNGCTSLPGIGFPIIWSKEEADFIGSIVVDGATTSKTICLDMEYKQKWQWADGSALSYNHSVWGGRSPMKHDDLAAKYTFVSGLVTSEWLWTDDCQRTLYKIVKNPHCVPVLDVNVSECFLFADGECYRAHSRAIYSDRIVNNLCHGVSCNEYSWWVMCPKNDSSGPKNCPDWFKKEYDRFYDTSGPYYNLKMLLYATTVEFVITMTVLIVFLIYRRIKKKKWV